ncbi:MAG: ubiquinone biosynthesis hydroxylase [Cohaesibacteraceae bacterium]|nr:ubiquinone biosynthesis hydroxylase [Cohaesibacteraceae bacterium]
MKNQTVAHSVDKQYFDLVVAGGNYVGLSLAVAIKQALPEIGVCVVEPRHQKELVKDSRSSAVAAAARNLLNVLGVWADIEPHAQPINDMVITDSKLSDVVRPTFLTFDGKLDDGQPFAHMVPNGVMVASLYQKALQSNVTLITGDLVSNFDLTASGVQIELKSGLQIRTKLLAAADGVRSSLRELAGISVVQVPYDQIGIVTTVAHERPHEGRAIEHFLPSGPFAILPLKGNQSSLVWSEKTYEAERLLKMDDFTFQIELERRFGRRLGDLEILARPRGFPLGLSLARSFVKNRFALLGDAAHGIHPIAGQGLNLGFKDVAALAETVVNAARLGQDFGTLDVLENYQQWRRFDTVQMGITSDVLNRVFSNNSEPMRFIRDFGLGLVDRIPALKTYFINEAAGGGDHAPRLLQGELI